MFLENEIEERTLALYESTFDHHLSMIINEDAIYTTESVGYYEESASDKIDAVKEFFSKLWDAIKKFCERSTEVIKDKIAEIKQKRLIDKIEKSAIKNINNITINNIDMTAKQIKEVSVTSIKLSAEYTKKVRSAKSTEEINKIETDFDEKLRRLNDELSVKKINKEIPIGDAFGNALSEQGDWIVTYSQDIIDKFNDQATDYATQVAKMEEQEEIDAEIAKRKEVVEARKEAIKNFGTKTTAFFKKVKSKFTKTHLAVLGAIVATATTALAGKKMYDNHKAVSESVEETSVDMNYLFDELCESASGMFEEQFNAYEAALSDMDFDSENFFEGANLESREHFKQFKKEHSVLMKKYKSEVKSGKYKEAIATLKTLKKKNDAYMKKIYAEVDTAGSIAFGFFLTGGFPFLLRSIITALTALLIPIVGGLAGFAASIATLIERINVIIDDCKRENRGLTVEDANLYKNAIKVRMKEYNKLYDYLIQKVQTLMQQEKQAVKESADDLQDYYDSFFTTTESVEDDEHSGYDSFDDILSDLDMDF